MEHKYRVELAKRPTNDGFINRWIITDKYVPLYRINKWLDNKIEENTNKRYAYALISYLKYLDVIGKEYFKVDNQSVIEGYIKHLLHGDENENIYLYEPKKSFQTVRNNLSIVLSFYKWLDGENTEFSLSSLSRMLYNKTNRKAVSKRYLYGQVWSDEFDLKIKNEFRFKEKRNYRKWYTKEVVEIVASNFKTIRDKIVFLISVEGGCRIDEILSIKYCDYDSYDRKIFISKSKTFSRDIYLPDYVCDEIDRYINTERQTVESIKGILEPLFINLNNGKNQGEQLQYINYYNIFKKCVKRAGFVPSEFITHSGRSTRAQELIEHQVLYPEDGITDIFIQEVMGWSSIDSIKPYKKQFNPKIMKETLRKVKERKRKE